jgi:hypothetical protein
MSDWKSKLDETYNDYNIPLDRSDQYALLLAYRRALAAILLMEEKVRRQELLNNKQAKMIQEWILKNPSYEVEITEEDWNMRNKKISPFKE